MRQGGQYTWDLITRTFVDEVPQQDHSIPHGRRVPCGRQQPVELVNAAMDVANHDGPACGPAADRPWAWPLIHNAARHTFTATTGQPQLIPLADHWPPPPPNVGCSQQRRYKEGLAAPPPRCHFTLICTKSVTRSVGDSLGRRSTTAATVPGYTPRMGVEQRWSWREGISNVRA